MGHIWKGLLLSKRLYSITDVHKVFGNDWQPTQKAKVCYARVSSEHQRDDLELQITDLQQRYPGHEIISDIGSGLNWKRRNFQQARYLYPDQQERLKLRKWMGTTRRTYNQCLTMVEKEGVKRD